MKQVAALMKAWAIEREHTDSKTAQAWNRRAYYTTRTGKNIWRLIAK